jgi:hypothetical protein
VPKRRRKNWKRCGRKNPRLESTGPNQHGNGVVFTELGVGRPAEHIAYLVTLKRKFSIPLNIHTQFAPPYKWSCAPIHNPPTGR